VQLQVCLYIFVQKGIEEEELNLPKIFGLLLATLSIPLNKLQIRNTEIVHVPLKLIAPFIGFDGGLLRQATWNFFKID